MGGADRQLEDRVHGVFPNGKVRGITLLTLGCATGGSEGLRNLLTWTQLDDRAACVPPPRPMLISLHVCSQALSMETLEHQKLGSCLLESGSFSVFSLRNNDEGGVKCYEPDY